MKKFLIGLLLVLVAGGAGLMMFALKDSGAHGGSVGDSIAAISDKLSKGSGKQDSSGGMQFVDPSQTMAEDGSGGMLEKIKYARKKNRDTEGWLRIPNTAIDNAVMQADNNEKYWRMNEKMEYSVFGCYYADYRCSLASRTELSPNTVIYGHSDVSGEKDKPDGKEFSQLHKFADIEFARNNPYIYLATKEEEMTWEIFAVFYTDINFDYINVKAGENQIEEIISEAKERSIYNYPINPTAEDKILTLSTCTVKYGDRHDQRFVVMGRLINYGEDDIITVDIEENMDAKQPQF